MKTKSIIRGKIKAAAFEVSLTPLEILAADEILEILKMLEKRVDKEIEETQNRIDLLKDEFDSLSWKDGTVEYKNIRNKAGKEYYYYYYRPPGKPRRSIYLGQWEEAAPMVKSLKRAREIKKELKALRSELDKLEREKDHITFLILQVDALKDFKLGDNENARE